MGLHIKNLLQNLTGITKVLLALILFPMIGNSTPVTFEFEGVIGLTCFVCGDGSEDFGTGVTPGTPFIGRYTFDSDTVATPSPGPNRVDYFGMSVEFTIGTEFVSGNNASTAGISIHNGPPSGDSYTLFANTFVSGSIAGISIDSFSWVVSGGPSLFADLSLPTDPDFFGPLLGSRVCIGDCFSGEILEGEITALRLVQVPDPFTIAIDIKPGGDRNSINPRSRGKIPVAILTTSIADGDSLDFDAIQVDAATITFGPNGASIAHSQAHVEDVDGDGDSDLVLHFKTQETGISCGDTEATLIGETFGGDAITGTDAVKTSGCK